MIKVDAFATVARMTPEGIVAKMGNHVVSGEACFWEAPYRSDIFSAVIITHMGFVPEDGRELVYEDPEFTWGYGIWNFEKWLIDRSGLLWFTDQYHAVNGTFRVDFSGHVERVRKAEEEGR
jgi:hypothetical protein